MQTKSEVEFLKDAVCVRCARNKATQLVRVANGSRDAVCDRCHARPAAVPAIVRQIVGRCHVGQSDRAVIRYFVSRLKHGYATWRALPVTERKTWMRHIIRAHAENRGLYFYVMGGSR
jgi:hypothetical protein